jgi:hypothetical protein
MIPDWAYRLRRLEQPDMGTFRCSAAVTSIPLLKPWQRMLTTLRTPRCYNYGIGGRDGTGLGRQGSAWRVESS